MPTDTRPEPFHPDLRLARWIPKFSVGPRLLRIMRGSRKPLASALAVTIEERLVAGPAGDVRLRVFRPAGTAAPTPALLWIHGGGLIFGSPEQDDAANADFAARLGITVAAVAYRLAPEHPGPAALDDVRAGYRGLLEHAEELGIDPTRIVIGGASAGGGLAAALAARLHDDGGQQPVFQLLAYPMLDDRTVVRTDLDERHVRVWSSASNRFAWTSYLGRAPGAADVDPLLAPARRADLSGLPPAWIGVGTLDLFYEEDLDYARRLEAAGVACALHVVPGAFHGFDATFRRAGVSRSFHDEQVRALRAVLAPAAA